VLDREGLAAGASSGSARDPSKSLCEWAPCRGLWLAADRRSGGGCQDPTHRPRVSGVSKCNASLGGWLPVPETTDHCGTAREDTATAEEYVPSGVQLERSRGSPTLFANLLWRLIDRCAPLHMDESLSPPPPWVAVGSQEAECGPCRTAQTRISTRTRSRAGSTSSRGEPATFSSVPTPASWDNLDWDLRTFGGETVSPLVVHDWDSVAARPEATVAGAASAVFHINRRTGCGNTRGDRAISRCL